ncbi:MAG: hypothetical protein D6729_14955 [Deltaproteobacteria bacterium]|nr:MAG: hypothetical protein D6729_14955 [Deltaproteobacteria bacterium]
MKSPVHSLGLLLRDPRHFQLAALSAVLGYGVLALDLPIEPAIAAVIPLTALSVQWLACRLARIRFDPRSVLISSLSLILLLRTHSLLLAVLATVLAIGSKFVLRTGGRHIFNPTALGIAVVAFLFDGAWVSPGQWGSALTVAFFVACLGILVVWRSERSDVTIAFLLAFPGMLFARALYLGDPWAIPLHQLGSGALVLFAFFMISDPKTLPDTRLGRILFAFVVAALAMWLRFSLWEQNALIYALVLTAPFVPLLDRLFPGPRYEWPGEKGVTDASSPAYPDRRAGLPAPAAFRLRLLRLLRGEGRREAVQQPLARGPGA